MTVRRKARETALQVLYKIDIAEIGPGADFSAEMDELPPGTEARRFCEVLVRGVLGSIDEIDRLIEANTDNWTVARMSIVDRNILRIAAYEMKCMDTPYKVVIDEAVELAKRFGADESGAFINGIIDRIGKSTARTQAARG